MATYVFRGGDWVDKSSGEKMYIPDRDGVCCPRVVGDIPEYASPIDGRMITTRGERREDLKRNNCYEMDPPKDKDRHFRNKKYEHAYAHMKGKL